MAEGSIPRRVAKLEAKRRFLDWFVRQRFYQSLTEQDTTLLPEPHGAGAYDFCHGWPVSDSYTKPSEYDGPIRSYDPSPVMEGR
jgi:hypothetical protein